MDKLFYQYDVTVSIVAYKSNPEEIEQAVRSLAGTSLRILTVIVDNSPTEELGPSVVPLGRSISTLGRILGMVQHIILRSRSLRLPSIIWS